MLICAIVGYTDMYEGKRKEFSPALSFKLRAVSTFHIINDSSANLACPVHQYLNWLTGLLCRTCSFWFPVLMFSCVHWIYLPDAPVMRYISHYIFWARTIGKKKKAFSSWCKTAKSSILLFFFFKYKIISYRSKTSKGTGRSIQGDWQLQKHKWVPLPLKTALPLSAAIYGCAQILSPVQFHPQGYAGNHFKLNSQALFPFWAKQRSAGALALLRLCFMNKVNYQHTVNLPSDQISHQTKSEIKETLTCNGCL